MSASRTPSPSPSPTSCSLPDLPQVEEQLRQNRHQVGCLRRRSADAATLAATLVERDRVVQQPLQQMGSCCETRSDYGSGSLGRTRSCSLLDLTQPCVTPRGNVKQWDEDQDENDDSFEAVFALIQTGEQQKALEALDDLLASVPSSHPRGLFLKAEILHSLGKNSETIQCLDTFLSISHMKTLYPQALVMKAQALHNLGRYAEANTCFSQYLVHFPDDTAVLSAKGLALFEMGDPESAILSYDATLAISPGDLCALVNRGIALRSTGNHTEAIASFEAALRSCPNHPDILTHKGIELFLLGKHEAALECYEASLLTCPNNPRVLTNKGAALYHLGRHSDAIQCYNAVLEVCPDDHFALNNKGSSLSELGLFEEATKCYDAALQVCPNDSGSLDNKGVALDALGYSTEAIKCFELALVTEKPAKTSKIMYHKGIALYHAGLFSKAVRHFQISMEAAANTSDELLPSSIAKVNSMIALYNLGTASTPNCKQIIQDTLGFTVMPSNSWELTDVSLLEPQNDTGRSDASRKIQGKPIPATCFKKAPFHLPNEEYLLSQLHHGNVLQVDGTTQIGSELYIVTERTSLSLYELVKSKSPPLLTLLQIAWGIAKGMEHLARFNIFYGTLNCSNIYFSSKENLCPKLGDIPL
ncbi:tetratricopeptide repeat protein [Pelomyxa schiedti]|nr:tetratricopeptide repeat protein [Pelomyxa schiedti]